MKYLLYFLFSFAMAQPLAVPPADTMNTLFVTVFNGADVSTIQVQDDTHLILELSQRDPESFYKYEHWRYEQEGTFQILTRNGEEQRLDDTRLEWLQALLNETLSLQTPTPHFLNYDYFNDDNRWFFASDETRFVSLVFWEEASLLQSWYADPKIDGVAGYTQNDARLDTLLTRHFATHRLISESTINDFASELPEYFELSDDIELGLLLASQQLEAKSAFDVWREIQGYPQP